MKKTKDNVNGDEAIISYEIASEYGIIEKLCPKYGFIKCLNKDNQEKRLFFHYTATKDPFEELQVGDNVSFHRGVSNGKPLATDIIFQSHVEIIEGLIIKMPKKQEKGSISYKYNDECFYLSFNKDDLYDDFKLKSKDEVLFEKIERDGILYATKIRKKYNKPLKVQGIVSSVKDKFGFIDRLDQVKEIYFNLSASPEGVVMKPGLELEFNVKHLRNGKEEAVNLRLLEPGTVKFIDLLEPKIHGTLLRSPDCKRGLNGADMLAGNISYVWPSNEGKVMQIPFGEKDKRYPYTLHPGDIVSFRIGIDRRDQLQRACKVELSLDSFPSRKESRHIGVITNLDGNAGLIEPDMLSDTVPPADSLVSFKTTEWLAAPDPIVKFTVVSYTPLQMSKTVNGVEKWSTTALRVMPCPDDVIKQMNRLRLYHAGSLTGIVKNPAYGSEDLGIIICQIPNSPAKRTVGFTVDDVVKCKLKAGDEVTFGCLDHVDSDYLPAIAFHIQLVPGPATQTSSVNNSSISANKHSSESHRGPESRKHRSRTLDDKATILLAEQILQTSPRSLRGWIVILKEYFGFIETSDHKVLYKFGPNVVKKSKLSTELKVGSAVEFTPFPSNPSTGGRPRRTVDLFVKVLSEPITKEPIIESRLVGTIVRPLLISENSDTDNPFNGLLGHNETNRQFFYSMKSLVSFRQKLHPGDQVLFDVAQLGADHASQLAMNVMLLRQSARVSTVTKSMVTIERLINEEDGDNGLPCTFQIDTSRSYPGADPKTLAVDDVIQIDIDIDRGSSDLFVASFKMIKPAENSSSRKVFKVSGDELLPRILHRRGPRLPEGESIGFTEQLRRLPPLSALDRD